MVSPATKLIEAFVNPPRISDPQRLRGAVAGATVLVTGASSGIGEAAARKLLASSIDVLPCRSFDDVFAAVQTGAAACAVIPIENTLAGSVHENYDHLQNFELPIVALGERLARPTAGVRIETLS